MVQHTQSRYPGIRAFEQKEQYLFFGRQEETKRLYSLIKTQNLVVLFAKSGIGKSSLVNASIIPLLEDDKYYPIKIRFQDLSHEPEETFKEALLPYVDEGLLKRNTTDAKGAKAWEYLRACRFDRNGMPLTPVIVMDQFEEFFDHDEEFQKELVMELADMVSNRLPNRIQDRLRSIPFLNRTDEDLLWHDPIQVKVLIAIRSDRISLLDDLSSEIVGILHNRFHLKPLKRKAAKNAIVKPALLGGSEFPTPPFAYDDAVMNKILDGLSNKNGEIESFQLQLLCQHIEKRLQKNKEMKDGYTVKESFFANEKGFNAALNSILNNYYENELAELTDDEQKRSKKFIEEGLIVGGRRAALTEGVEKERYQIDRGLLEKLLESRIIRQENTHLGKSYEISHDTLVAPIQSSYEIRKTREDKIKEQEARAKERKRLITAVGLALVGFVLAAFALVFYFKANSAKADAEAALQRFKEQQFDSAENRYQRYVSVGGSYFQANNFEEAITSYELALQTLKDYGNEIGDTTVLLKIDNGGEQARRMITETQNKGGNAAKFQRLLNSAIATEEKGKLFFVDAKAIYLRAKAINYDNATVDGKLLRLNGKMENAFDEFKQRGKKFFAAEEYQMALDNYNQALRIKPRNTAVQERVAACKERL